MAFSPSDMQAIMSNPQLQALFKQYSDNEQQGTWAELLGYVPGPGVPPVGTPLGATTQAAGYVTINGQQVPISSQTEQAGYVNIPGIGNVPTQSALAQYAGLMGTLPSSMLGPGGDTLAKQGMTGFLTNADGSKTATTTEQGMGLQAINNILNANNNPANAFSYLSKLKGIQNLGPATTFLGNGIQNATGQSIGSLAQQPIISNAQLMAQQMQGLLNPAANSALSNLFPTLMSSAGMSPSAGGSGQGATNPGKIDVNSLLSSLVTALGGSVPSDVAHNAISGLSNSSPTAKPAIGGTSTIPTGWGTSAQQLSKMSPTLRGSYMDLVQNQGGENASDFQANNLAGAPEFAKSSNAGIGSFGRF